MIRPERRGLDETALPSERFFLDDIIGLLDHLDAERSAFVGLGGRAAHEVAAVVVSGGLDMGPEPFSGDG